MNLLSLACLFGHDTIAFSTKGHFFLESQFFCGSFSCACFFFGCNRRGMEKFLQWCLLRRAGLLWYYCDCLSLSSRWRWGRNVWNLILFFGDTALLFQVFSGFRAFSLVGSADSCFDGIDWFGSHRQRRLLLIGTLAVLRVFIFAVAASRNDNRWFLRRGLRSIKLTLIKLETLNHATSKMPNLAMCNTYSVEKERPRFSSNSTFAKMS